MVLYIPLLEIPKKMPGEISPSGEHLPVHLWNDGGHGWSRCQKKSADLRGIDKTIYMIIWVWIVILSYMDIILLYPLILGMAYILLATTIWL